MITKETPNIQRLESLDDLGALIPGDVVELFFEYRHWNGCEETLEETLPFVYYGDSCFGHKQFITPKVSREEYVLMHRAFPEKIELREGVITLIEGFASTYTFSPCHSDFQKMNNILISSGLRD